MGTEKKKKKIYHPTPLCADYSIASATEYTGIGNFWPEGQDEEEEFAENYGFPKDEKFD